MRRAVRELLLGAGSFAPDARELPWRMLVGIVLTLGFVHGACMGSSDLRALQSLYSALKVPLLLAISTALCLPSFYALNAVLGLRDDFAAALRGVLAAQATVAVTLASLAPVVLLVYVSSDDYPLAIVANGVVFALASLAGQSTLTRHYERLVARNARHRLARRAWLCLYVFVAIQLAWVLRPFVGDPHLVTSFFRANSWSNAYVVLVHALAALVGR